MLSEAQQVSQPAPQLSLLPDCSAATTRKQTPLATTIPNPVPHFEQTILPHLDAAYNLARWLTGHEQDAQDVVQEACVRAFRSFGGFHGENGRAWLLTIVRHAAYDTLQKNKPLRLMTAFDEALHGGGAGQLDAATPATVLRGLEDEQTVRHAIEALPLEFREILVLRHQENLSYKEIAGIAGIPPGTVMSRLARARSRLKELLSMDAQQQDRTS